MLLLINDGSELSPAEERLAEWVQWSPAQPGVALLNVEVPDRDYSRQLDALIWTPQRCIAVEVKGFRTRQDGVLVVPPNGPWRMDDGRIADIYGNDVDHNPMNQVRSNTLAAKNWIGETTGRRFYIHGLVLVMLLPGQDVPALQAVNTPNLTDIVVEDFDVFRYYLHLDANDPTLWTADLVDDVIARLGLSGLYGDDRDQLAVALGEITACRSYNDTSNSPF